MPDQISPVCADTNCSSESCASMVCWGVWCGSCRVHPAFSRRCTSPGHPTASCPRSTASFHRSTVSSRHSMASSRHSMASFLPSSGPTRDHHSSDAGCCRHQLDLGQRLPPGPNHICNPAYPLFFCFGYPSDRYAGPTCPGPERDISCPDRPGTVKAESDHPGHNCLLPPLSRPMAGISLWSLCQSMEPCRHPCANHAMACDSITPSQELRIVLHRVRYSRSVSSSLCRHMDSC